MEKEMDTREEALGLEHAVLNSEDKYYERQARQESVDVLVQELARKHPAEIAILFDKIMHVGGKEAVDALVFIGDLSQA